MRPCVRLLQQGAQHGRQAAAEEEDARAGGGELAAGDLFVWLFVVGCSGGSGEVFVCVGGLVEEEGGLRVHVHGVLVGCGVVCI